MDLRSVLFPVLALALVGAAHADIGWTVDYDDPYNEYPQYRSTITQNLLAAGNAWGSHLVGSGTIDVHISFASIGTADAAPAASVYDHDDANGIHIFQFGTATEINTGVDPNGGAADINIRLGRDWMNNAFWWDPTPTTRTAALPGDKVDGQSTLMHEIGHGLAFSGWLNPDNGKNDGNGMSPYDENVSFDGSTIWFNGEHASAAYGGPVPLTKGNYAHYGNLTGPGSDLVGTRLMNGVYTYLGTRWSVTDLDLGILADSGYTLKVAPVPEPTTFAALGLGALAFVRRRRK